MPERQIDPARLEGEALRDWYLQSPDDRERQREEAAARRHAEFFDGLRSADPDPGFRQGPFRAPERDPDPGFARKLDPSWVDIDPGIRWIPGGPGRWRGERADQEGPDDTKQPFDEPFVDRGLAGPDDGGEFLDIGSRENNALKKFYIEKYGYWPKTKDGRDYEVSHKRAIADGGKNTLDNIEPIHPDEHRPMHAREGDSGRWGKRSSIARAFGRRVEPWHGGRALRSFGLAGDVLNLPGLVLDPPRTDSFANFTTDMLGLPSIDVYRRVWNGPKWTTPDCPPGWECI